MKIPKYIEEALRKRSKASVMLSKFDYIVTKFIEEHDIDVDEYDYNGGCEAIINPYESEERIKTAILNHKE